MPLYYEPFVGLIPKEHRLFHKKEIESGELEMEDILLLEDGHCFRNQVLNLCSLEDLNKLEIKIDKEGKKLHIIDEGLGMTSEEVQKYINEVAFSGAEEFLDKYKDKLDDSGIIGHFGY